MKNSFQMIPNNALILDKKRIDLWELPLNPIQPEIMQVLNTSEIAQADRFYFEKHRRRFSMARSLMRRILGLYLNCDPKQLTFNENKYGKPNLPATPWLSFNLSHSGELGLLAVGYEEPLGVDLEFFSARPYLGVGHEMFSSDEYLRLKKLPLTTRPLSFFQTWSQKEALIKACGLGLSYPTKQFSVPSLPSTVQTIHDTLHDSNWIMQTFMPQIGCCAALCHKQSVSEIRYSSDILDRL